MGIAANQARLLSLTARKCDLESQMQIILNNKLNTSKETQSIADNYNNAISNRRLFIFKPSTSATTSNYQDLSAQNLYNAGGLLLATKSGKNYVQVDVSDKTAVEKGLRDGTIYLVKAADVKTQDPKSIVFDKDYGGTTDGILNATSAPTNTNWEIIDWRTNPNIMDELDKSDDAAAQQNYERLMKTLDTKEATLDLEMNSIQTAHSAITNEIESVKKVVTKNTEESFKYFS